MRRKGMKRLAAFLALSLILAGIAPAMQAEAASLYKKFPTYTRYENKYGKAGMTADNGALENLLAAKTYKYIYLRNVKTAEKYTIPDNSKFAGKRLRVKTPLSKVVNHASSMKVVKITEVESWTEYGKGNSFAVVDENAKFEVGTGSNVDKLYFQADNGKVDLDVKGDVKKTGFYGDKMDAEVTISQGTTGEFRVAAEDSKVDVTVEKTAEVNTVKVVKDADVTLNVNDGVEKVVVDAPANVTITGDSEKVKEVAVEVGGKAEGAKVTSDVPVKAEVEAKADITLKEGAEGSTVKKADEKVEVAVKNETKKDVTVSTEGTTKTETVPSTNKDTTGGGTTGGGSTGGGTTGGGSGSGSTGGDYYPPTGGGDTPNPPSPPEPTVTPAAIKTISVTAINMTGDAIVLTRSDGTNVANLTITGDTDTVTVKLYNEAGEEVAATATIGSSPVADLTNISVSKGDIKTFTITETETEATTTLEIHVTKEGEEPAQVITTNISGFTVTATNITGTATTAGPTSAGENGKYTATAAVNVTNAATTVTVTVDIPVAASVSSISGTGASAFDTTAKTFTIDLTSNAVETVTREITITETNGAETVLTITVTVEEEAEPEEPAPEDPVEKPISVSAPATYTAEFNEETGVASAKFVVEGITNGGVKLSGSAIEGIKPNLTNTQLEISITISTEDSAEQTLVYVPKDGSKEISYNDTTGTSIIVTFTPPTVDEFMTKVAEEAEIKEAGKVVSYAPHIDGDATNYTTYAAYKENSANVETLKSKEERIKTAEKTTIDSTGLICILNEPAYENGPQAEAVYYTKDGKLICWWDAPTSDDDTTATDGDVCYHDLMLNLTEKYAQSIFYVKEVTGSDTVWYRIDISKAELVTAQ